jgi:hypothetical protein
MRLNINKPICYIFIRGFNPGIYRESFLQTGFQHFSISGLLFGQYVITLASMQILLPAAYRLGQWVTTRKI